MRIKRWNGKSWVDHLPKRWSGSSWQDAVVRRFNGKAWEVISEQTYTKTWNATWSQSYNGANTNTTTKRVARWGDTVSHYAMWFGHTWDEIVKWNNLKSPHVIYQGVTYIVSKKTMPRKRNTHFLYQGSRGDEHGVQRSMIGFNDSDIRNHLKGSKIEKVEIYLKNETSWQSTGADAYVGAHNNSSAPSDFSESKYGLKSELFSKGQGKWITVTNSLGELLRDNKAKGVTLYANSGNTKYYGIFHSHTAGTATRPKIRITYKK